MNYDTTKQIKFNLLNDDDTLNRNQISYNHASILNTPKSEESSYELIGFLSVIDTVKRGNGIIDTIQIEKIYSSTWGFIVKNQR